MKKAGAIISLLIISILAINFFYIASAQTGSVDSTFKSVDNKIKQLNQVQKELSAEETRNAYLQQKITEYLQSTELGKFVLKLHEDLKKLNPVFKFLFGIEYSFTAIFFMTVLTWIVIWVYIHRSLYVFDIWMMEKPSYALITKQVLALGGSALLSFLGVTPGIAILLSTPYYLVLTVIMILLTVLFLIIILMFYEEDTPLKLALSTLGALIISWGLTYFLSTLSWLKSLIEWLTALPGWLNKLIAIILFVFALYYSMAYSRMLSRQFGNMKKKKQISVLERRVERLENKMKDEGGLSESDRQNKLLAEQTLAEFGKEISEKG